MGGLDDAQKAVSLIFPGFRFGQDDPDRAERLVETGVGGFCLYGGSVREISGLTARLQAKAPRPLLFCADYETGLAQHCAGGTALPSNMGLGAAGSDELAFEKGAITGREARAIGVDWVLAPVCDLATFAGNPIVSTRAFSSEPAKAARLAGAYLRGLKSEGALSCLKHFPGHGEARTDSHLDLPAIEVERSLLEKRELAPFRALAAEADAVMTGHLLVPALEPDSKIPYSLSRDVGRTLRAELGFAGLVSSDALNMKAVCDRFDELDAARRVLLGGSDILLVPVDAAALALRLTEAAASDAALRAAAAAALARLDKALASVGPARPKDASIVGCAAHLESARRMAERCLAWSGAPRPALAGRARYFEPGASGPGQWRGQDFVLALRETGIEVLPYEGRPASGETLIVGAFLSPHAYSGRIAYDDETRAAARKALSSSAGALVVSFGSPFVFEALGAGGLCTFSPIAASQRAAALALRGRVTAAGRLPVAAGA